MFNSINSIQKSYERNTAEAGLDLVINEHVNETDLTPLVDKFSQYIVDIAATDAKHTEHHVSLLQSVDPKKAISTGIKSLIKADLLKGTSYLDRNVVANRLGKKLLPKSIKKGNKTVNIKTVELTLGLNIINALATMNIVSYRMLHHDNNNISSIIINSNLIDESLKEHALRVRASSFMVAKPMEHTEHKAGGYLTTPQTMLNGSGYNSISTQSDVANLAINHLQDTQYSIRANYSNDLINEYMSQDKWFDSKGKFMQLEWDKFRFDLSRASKAECIYFPMAYDDRGRMYERSTYIKYQGDKYQKAMLEFRNKEVVTEGGMMNLKIALTNEIYTDKCSFEDALEWFNSQSEDQLSTLVANSNPTAKTMYLDYLDAKAGNPIGTITHWDATNSALQFYSLLGKDEIGAALCNVVNTGSIADAYGKLAEALNTACKVDTFNRSTVKHAFMIFFYGGMEAQLLDNTETIKDDSRFAGQTLRSIFPTEYQGSAWDIFEGAMLSIAPSAYKLMNLIYSYNSAGRTKFNWTMPDGFKVETTSTITYGYRHGTSEPIRTGKGPIRGWFIDHNGKTHEGSISVKLEEYDAFSRALAPNLIHSIDAYFGREVIKRCWFDVSFIHDSFGVHPNYAHHLRAIAKEVAIELLESNLLEDILNQLCPATTANAIKNGRLSYGNLSTEAVEASEYILR